VNVIKSLKLMNKYSECPLCGSTAIGNGEGALIIEGEIFTRSCKCGWRVEVKDTESTE
jgi:hypothetical protein